MTIPARRYSQSLAAAFAVVAIPAAVFRLIASKDVADMWGVVQWISVGLLWFTTPVSLVWWIIAVRKKEPSARRYLVWALAVPVFAAFAATLINFRVMDSG